MFTYPIGGLTKTEKAMAKIEEGKYYVTGEGFYKCIDKVESTNRYVVMDSVIIKNRSLSYHEGLTYLEEECERRMVECSEADYKFILGQIIPVYTKMNAYHTAVIKNLWANKDKEQ